MKKFTYKFNKKSALAAHPFTDEFLTNFLTKFVPVLTNFSHGFDEFFDEQKTYKKLCKNPANP